MVDLLMGLRYGTELGVPGGWFRTQGRFAELWTCLLRTWFMRLLDWTGLVDILL
jgi:hypothetical protein